MLEYLAITGQSIWLSLPQMAFEAPQVNSLHRRKIHAVNNANALLNLHGTEDGVAMSSIGFCPLTQSLNRQVTALNFNRNRFINQ